MRCRHDYRRLHDLYIRSFYTLLFDQANGKSSVIGLTTPITDCRLVGKFSRCSMQRHQRVACNRTLASNCRDVREMGMREWENRSINPIKFCYATVGSSSNGNDTVTMATTAWHPPAILCADLELEFARSFFCWRIEGNSFLSFDRSVGRAIFPWICIVIRAVVCKLTYFYNILTRHTNC